MQTNITLTPRQTQTLQSLAEEGSVKRVAHKLDITPSTVNTHLRAIHKALGVSTSIQAVYIGISLDIIKKPISP